VKVIALVKQVPHPPAIEFDEETKSLRREGVPLVLNPFDREAVARAAELGDEVVAMTMGPPQANEALRECLALGAHRCVHLSDPLFAVADTIGTSRTLAMAIEREGADLVLCGRKAVDAETWQVPPEVAAFLGWPHLTNAALVRPHGDRLRVTRETDTGHDVYELPLPAVVSLARPRLQAAEPEDEAGRIALWNATDLAADVRPGDKRFGQSGSPTRVLAVRDVTPERARLRVASPQEAAEAVRRLLAERSPEPADWEKPAHIAEQPGRRYNSWTWVELDAGRPTRHSLELVGRSRTLAGKLGGRNSAVVLGHGIDSAADDLICHGAEHVVLLDDPAFSAYHPDVWTAALRRVIERHRPHVLLFPATAIGRDLGPRVAGELELGMTGDCVGVDIAKAGRLLQQKPAYGGNIVSVIMGSTNPQLASVRARMFEPLEAREGAAGDAEQFPLDGLPELRVRITERPGRLDTTGHTLDAANVVVCAGAQAGGPDAVAGIEALALEEGAAVGATHEVCALGWMPWSREIGLYGRAVAPRLLIAVGVPGEFWEVTGWVKAGVVAAVTPGTESAVRESADVVLTGSWRDALPVLLMAAR
jgi:electron transfer flavoprotein alpha subunit